MNQTCRRLAKVWIWLFLVAVSPLRSWGGEPKVQILSPKDGSRITQAQQSILISGKVATEAARSPDVDIFFVLDISGSTAHYAGVDFGDLTEPSDGSGSSGLGSAQITIFGGGINLGQPPMRNLRNSILAAEVAATRRLLSQLNPQSTRIGVITFSEGAKLLQPLTHDFEQVRRALDEILRGGPHGGTNLVEGIRLGIRELLGFGSSGKRPDAIKVEFLLTDGFPTLPIGKGKRADPQDTNLAINAARLAGKAGIKVHVFALGEEALSYPRAAVGVAKESGGLYTPVSRPADILGVLDNISVVGVDYVQVVNETIGRKASHLRLAADGFFSSALPVVTGANRIQVYARANDGSVGRDSITVHYQPGGERALELEVFLEKEKSLTLEVERLGKSREEIQREIDRGREESLGRSAAPPPPAGGLPR